jgi:hypothetical protein
MIIVDIVEHTPEVQQRRSAKKETCTDNSPEIQAKDTSMPKSIGCFHYKNFAH